MVVVEFRDVGVRAVDAVAASEEVNPAMQMGWPGVVRVLTPLERIQSEKDWDDRYRRSLET